MEEYENEIWKSYRESGCTCQVEDAAGFPTIVLHDEKCPIESHRVNAAIEAAIEALE